MAYPDCSVGYIIHEQNKKQRVEDRALRDSSKHFSFYKSAYDNYVIWWHSACDHANKTRAILMSHNGFAALKEVI